MLPNNLKELKFCPYQVLSLDPKKSHTSGEIKKAFKAFAIKYHPDKNKAADAGEVFQKGKTAS